MQNERRKMLVGYLGAKERTVVSIGFRFGVFVIIIFLISQCFFLSALEL